MGTDAEDLKSKKDELSEHGEERSWYAELGNIFRDVIDLREGLDRYGTILSIRKNIHLKGINVWMLICAIVVASIRNRQGRPRRVVSRDRRDRTAAARRHGVPAPQPPAAVDPPQRVAAGEVAG